MEVNEKILMHSSGLLAFFKTMNENELSLWETINLSLCAVVFILQMSFHLDFVCLIHKGLRPVLQLAYAKVLQLTHGRVLMQHQTGHCMLLLSVPDSMEQLCLCGDKGLQTKLWQSDPPM